jgi:hypothetical protein
MAQPSNNYTPVEFKRHESFNPQQTAKETKEYYPMINKGSRGSTVDINNKERSANYERKPSASFMTDYLQQDTHSMTETF